MKTNQLVAVIAIFLIASSYIFIELALTELSPITIAFLRATIAAIFFLPILWIKETDCVSVLKGSLWQVLGMSFSLILLPDIFLNYGINLVKAPAASFIESTEPMITIILASLLLHEKIKIKHLVGILLATIGSFGIASEGFKINPLHNSALVGVVLVILGAISQAYSNILGKRLLYRFSPLQVMTWSFVLSSLCLLPVILLTGSDELAKISISFKLVAAIIGLSLIATVGGYLFYFTALSTIKVTQFAYYLYAIPIITTVYSFLVFKQNVQKYILLSGSLIIIGVIIAQSSLRYESTKK